MAWTLAKKYFDYFSCVQISITLHIKLVQLIELRTDINIAAILIIDRMKHIMLQRDLNHSALRAFLQCCIDQALVLYNVMQVVQKSWAGIMERRGSGSCVERFQKPGNPITCQLDLAMILIEPDLRQLRVWWYQRHVIRTTD